MKKRACTVLKTVLFAFLVFSINISSTVFAGPELRKTAMRTVGLNTGDSVILAYDGQLVPDSNIQSMLNSTLNNETGDFSLVKLVRILYFAETHSEQVISEEMETTLISSLSGLDYWLTWGEDQYCYWSENHMILWMSSAYLMRQLKGWEMDATLDQRLSHYLDLKLQYGFYEFFSSTYAPYTLAGLMNLVDFAEDESIRSKAEAAARLLMERMLWMVNDIGAYYPAAGRNYPEKYTGTPYGGNHTTITYIASGLCPQPTGSSHINGFLSTSSMAMDDIESSWTNELDISHSQGHSFSDKLTVHAGLNREDRTVFQWSAGGYFHPDVADDTVHTVDYYHLENNKHFNIFSKIPNFPSSWGDDFGKIGATFSRGSSIAGARIDIYKNRGIVLSSLDNYYGGYSGYQQWPWVATVDDIAVWTQSGEVTADWGDRDRLMQNIHLPWIRQEGNVAMILYWPNTEIRIADTINQMDTNVALYWPTDRFDETRTDRRWLIGKRGDSYVAVLCDQTKIKNGHYYSDADNGRQMWGVVVGNSTTHGSFDAFCDMIGQSTYTEDYHWTFYDWRYVYKAELKVDGKRIYKRW